MKPAAYISMIGVDERFQGKGFGGDLLVEGLRRIARVADQLGIAIVMLDVLDRGMPDRVAERKALYQGSNRCRQTRFGCFCPWRRCGR
jgi:GNAT superfamily N-acetyltransferase